MKYGRASAIKPPEAEDLPNHRPPEGVPWPEVGIPGRQVSRLIFSPSEVNCSNGRW
ncbi:hypothetical protein TBS_04090 [Thermobispora bispora]|uniref:Uncharacterized protein n=1 Tax=Thermobispora bispora (strain ATCC 19993 / DSM 43833 / CBS 139.67 / JCM 10125 / KCTC 9307 / NBRC 14880 / R51) TaxID=469371 RepID=D6YA02_THEBD|nr:hypothetical protein Tbis_1427 [Thermobispora bispora DSM 43833]